MTDLVVEVRGGVVQEVYCDDPRIRVVLVDWDEIEGPEPAAKAGVAWGSCVPISRLPDDTRAQFQKAKADKTGSNRR
jgi:hypothetical protein